MGERKNLQIYHKLRNGQGKQLKQYQCSINTQPTYNPQMTIYTGTPRTNKVKNGKDGKTYRFSREKSSWI